MSPHHGENIHEYWGSEPIRKRCVNFVDAIGASTRLQIQSGYGPYATMRAAQVGRGATQENRFELVIRRAQRLLLHRCVGRILIPKLEMRVVDSGKYLHFYKVDVRQTVLTGVWWIGRVVVSSMPLRVKPRVLKLLLTDRNEWIWI